MPIRATVRWVTVFYRQMRRDRAFVRAAAMAYATLVGLVPLLLLVFGIWRITGIGGGDPERLESFVFGTFLGDLREVREFLVPGLAQVDLRALSLVGLLALVVVAGRVYLMVERAYNDIFGVPMKRSLPYRLLVFWAALTAVPIAGGIALAGAADALPGGGGLALLQDFALSYLVLFAALKLFPCTTVHWGPAAVGALASAVLIAGGRYGFEYYVLLFKSDDPLRVIYGSVALIPVFLLWLYMLWLFVLFGVEIAYVMQNYGSLVDAERRQMRPDADEEHVSLDLVLEVAAQIAAHFGTARGPVAADVVASKCGVETRDAWSALSLLRDAGLLVESAAGFSMATDPDRVPLSEVAAAWRKRTESRRVGVTSSRARPVFQEVAAALDALPGTLGDAATRWAEKKDA